MTIRRRLCASSILVASLVSACPLFSRSQSQEEGAPRLSAVASLGLSAARAEELQKAMDGHNYLAAEKILLAEIDRDPHTPAAGRMLAFAGTVYFLNQDYLNAAIAWKKSDAISPLPPSLRFSLAMTYVKMSHPDWARPLLQALAQQFPQDALFPYWLGRLEYDARRYKEAIGFLQHAIELNPALARAYDNLGLCYFYDGQNELAVKNFNQAIELDRSSEHPSAWPYLNLAVAQQFLGELPSAQANLHEALRIDPSFASAHYQLGSVLEDAGKLSDAVTELREAARLNPTYPEPHILLARILHKLGQQEAAQKEAARYQELRTAAPKQ